MVHLFRVAPICAFICLLLSGSGASADEVFPPIKKSLHPWLKENQPKLSFRKTLEAIENSKGAKNANLIDMYAKSGLHIPDSYMRSGEPQFLIGLRQYAKAGKNRAHIRVLYHALQIKHGSPESVLRRADKLLKIYNSGTLDKNASALAMMAVAFHSVYARNKDHRKAWKGRAANLLGKANRLTRGKRSEQMKSFLGHAKGYIKRPRSSNRQRR